MKKSKRTSVLFYVLFILSMLFILAGCGSSSGGGGKNNNPSSSGDTSNIGNFVGTWSVTEIENGCGKSNALDGPYTYTVTESGSSIKVVTTKGLTFYGTVNGNTATGKVSFAEDGGETVADITITVSGNSLTGSASWTWSDPDGYYKSCSGTTILSGSR